MTRFPGLVTANAGNQRERAAFATTVTVPIFQFTRYCSILISRHLTESIDFFYK